MRRSSVALRTETPFKPIEGRRLSVLVAEQLQKAIISGALPEGDRLPPERELAERFQASRTSVQQAVHTLELMGLVTIRRGSNGGAFVTKPDFIKVSNMMQAMLCANQFDLVELYQARLVIEPGIAEIAARVATPEDVATLRASINATRNPIIRSGSHPHIGRNFHYLLACATGSELLVMLASSLLGLAQAARVPHRPSSGHHRAHSHDCIVDAIERRDGEAARRYTAEHLMDLLKSATKGTSKNRTNKARR
jgi:GntR family transcriptional repressor for pyruvate dehydrogenase complex